MRPPQETEILSNIAQRFYGVRSNQAGTVLNSPRAVQVGIYVVEAFVRLREVLALNRGLAQKFEELERKIATHDEQIQAIFEAIRQLMTPPENPPKEIGFHIKEGAVPYRGRRKPVRQ